MRRQLWLGGAVLLGTALVFAQDAPKETKAPLDIAASVKRATALLVDLQETLDVPKEATDAEKAKLVKDEWPYEGVYRERGEIPIGYRVGGTSIVAWALIESPHYGESKEAQAAVARGVDFLLEHLEHERMQLGFAGGYDVRGWGHTYALNLFLRLRAKELVPKDQAKKIDAWVKKLVDVLHQTEIVEWGGWNYARGKGFKDPAPASPFMTAPTLLALFEARRQGEKIDADVVQRALDALESCRTEAGAIPYTTKATKDEWPGATGRSPVTECTLMLAGRSDVERVRKAVDNFFEHWEWLEKRRRQTGTHVAPYGIAPYYVFYAHGYVAQAIEFLPEAEREGYRKRLHERLAQVQEASGGWNDRVFPRSENFGTAMGLLAMLAPSLPRPAGWDGGGRVKGAK
jgi:hypothetical protein